MPFQQAGFDVPVAETSTLALLGVAAILLGVLLLNQILGQRARERAADQAEDPEKELLLKFAHHDGDVVGETVAIEGDQVILKQAGVFKSVPLAQAEVIDGDVRLTGTIDWEDAVRKGQAWHAAKTAGHDPAITERLTRSEDVRAPALAALKSRDGEEE